MAGFSNYAENKLLDHVVGKTSFTAPTVYVALLTAAADMEAGTVTEVTNANNYSRKATSGTDWSAASGGSISNATTLSFPTASGSWGTVTHFALFDSGTYGGGNLILGAALTTSKAVGSGDTASFAAGSLAVVLD